MGGMHVFILEVHDYASTVGVVLIYGLYTVFQALYYALIGGIFHMVGAQLVYLPFCWIIGEWLRSQTIVGNMTGSLGYSQSYNDVVLQWASIMGVWGIAGLVMVINILIYQVLVNRNRRNVIFLIAMSLVILGGGMWLKRAPLSQSNPTPVMVVQGSHPQSQKLNAQFFKRIKSDYLHTTNTKLMSSDQSPTLIFWPETLVPQFNLHNQVFISQLNQLAFLHHTSVFFGTPTLKQGKLFNSIALMTPNGLSPIIYDKYRLMPFGEYWPLRSVWHRLGLQAFIPGSEYSQGHWHQPLFEHNGMLIGGGICLESMFPWRLQSLKRRGASLLFLIANNAWFNNSSAAEKHFQMGILRAVESLSYYIQSSNTGISGIVSPKGKILQQSQLNDRVQLSDVVYHVHHQSIYTRFGDWVIYLCIGVIAISILRRRFRCLYSVVRPSQRLQSK
jgi:apolipoprotein N-acyltransferase